MGFSDYLLIAGLVANIAIGALVIRLRRDAAQLARRADAMAINVRGSINSYTCEIMNAISKLREGQPKRRGRRPKAQEGVAA